MIRHDPRAAARVVAGTTGMVDPDFVMETVPRITEILLCPAAGVCCLHHEVCPYAPGAGVYLQADYGG